MSKSLTTAEFVSRANEIHGNKYDYSKVTYANNRTKVCIICPEHGEFWQTPDKHLAGRGCPKCGKTIKLSTGEFIEKAKVIHGNKYDYSHVEYSGKETKVCIVCSEHGRFWQTPHNHLKGQGCPDCAKTKPLKYTTKTLINEAISVHGEKYDYTKVKYMGITSPVEIICPEHGEFWQTPYLHLSGCGCPGCSKKIGGINKRLTKEEFVEKAVKTHGNKYDYSKVVYKTSKDKVCIICPEHGEFWQTPDKHLSGCGCPLCVEPFSKSETEIYDYIVSLIGHENVKQHDRTVLAGKEIDIYIPSLKFGIEFNGLYWHTTAHRPKNYHLSKTESAKSKGIRLIQIFEDEYLANKEIVLSKIKHILNYESLPHVGARKCNIKEIQLSDAKSFLTKYHIQGFVASSVYLGAFYKDTLMGVMSFKKENTLGKWELTRFAGNANFICPGLGGKLFASFVSKYRPIEIKSFADRRWTKDESNLYTILGFTLEQVLPPDYRYYNPHEGCIRFHKFGFRKHILGKKYNLSMSLTESEMTAALGYTKIYDCGLLKYVWKA